MRHTIYRSLLVLVIFFSSCDDYLDIEPKGEVIPTTIEDYEYLLSSVTLFNIPKLAILLGDDLFASWGINKNQLLSYEWSASSYTQRENDPTWNRFYSNVYVANTVLEGLEGFEETEEVKQLKAEALFHRSYAFFFLTNYYAKHYKASTAAEDLGIPLIFGISFNQTYKRNSVEEVYNRIITDVEDHIEFLPTTQDNKARPTKAASYGFLARVYLYKGQFEKAKQAAEKALTFESQFFDLRANPDGYPADFKDLKEVYMSLVMAEAPFFLKIVSATKNEVYNDPDDLRFTHLFSERWGSISYKRGVTQYGGSSTPEMYLIIAEADARANRKQEALDRLNEIRKYRFMEDKYQEIMLADVDDVFELVMTERRKELMFKGHRWFDVKRLNDEGKWNFTLERKDAAGVVVASLPPNDLRSVFEIPRKVIFEFNSNIVQNPR